MFLTSAVYFYRAYNPCKNNRTLEIFRNDHNLNVCSREKRKRKVFCCVLRPRAQFNNLRQ